MIKYKFQYDNMGYIIGFYDTLDSDYDYEGNFIDDTIAKGWYKFVDGSFVEDLERKKEIESETIKEEEIKHLEQNLNSTDYIMARMVEELMALDNPLTFIADTIKIFVAYRKKYKEQIANRKKWRERIEELGG